jgi:hypothetical protein
MFWADIEPTNHLLERLISFVLLSRSSAERRFDVDVIVDESLTATATWTKTIVLTEIRASS